MRSRPGGGVADVGLGRRSTMLDRDPIRNGLDVGRREAVPSARDSPYRPSTSQFRHGGRNGLYDTMSGQNDASNDRAHLRASPESSYSYRSSTYSLSSIRSPGRTPTPTAAAALDSRMHSSFRADYHTESDLLGAQEGNRQSTRTRRSEEQSRRDGSSAGRSVSNSTVRDYGEHGDHTITYKLESARRRRRQEEQVSYRDPILRLAQDQPRSQTELRSERSFTPSSSNSLIQGEEESGSRLPQGHDMPAEEKVDMWMRSGSASGGSADDSANRKRTALPIEFRGDMVSDILFNYCSRYLG
jgi:hypothetical protein